MSDTDNYAMIKKFSSKKNNVYLATSGEKELVVKFYTSGGKRKSLHEHSCLIRAREMGIPVPEPIARLENGIVMEYIAGENLCDALNREPREGYALALADWYAAWHSAFSRDAGTLLRGDGILKNFIWSGKLWGIDFEEACYGEPAADIGKVCASILNTDPMFTDQKFHLCLMLIKRYETRAPFKIAKSIDTHIARALNEAARWRPAGGKLLSIMAGQISSAGLTNLANRSKDQPQE